MMGFTSVEERKAYAAAHYARNKDRYNPARKMLRAEAKQEQLRAIKLAEKEAEKQEAKRLAKAKSLKEKERRAANAVNTKIPKTIEGQLAVLLRWHFANEIPKNLHRWNRNGCGYPLTSWLLGAPTGTKSKIIAVSEGSSRYPYRTNRASSEVLADRIAKRYNITFVQKSLLYQYVSRFYSGQADRSFLNSFIGTDETGEICMPGSGRDGGGSASIRLIQIACEKYGLDYRRLPLRAIIDEKVTNIILFIQLNEFLNLKR